MMPATLSTPGGHGTEAPRSAAESSQGLVLRNALILVMGQAVAMPLSILVNAIMARYLGPSDFGHFYLAGTLVGLGFLFVTWGQHGTLPALVARDHARAGEFLGSALAWRAGAAPLVYGLLALVALALGYVREVQVALALVSLNAVVVAFTDACLETVRGFERTDISAYVRVGQQLLTAVLMVPVLALGGRLPAALGVHITVSLVLAVLVARVLRPVGVGPLAPRRDTVKRLAIDGWSFLVFGMTMALQPNVDAVFLSKLAPEEVIGWYAATQKLIGAVCIPAMALIGALYPTLCRLHANDAEEFRSTARQALTTATVFVMPLALACGLYAEVGVRVFGSEKFGPMVGNLRALAPFVFLVYFSMTLGSTLLAAGRQREWAFVQVTSVLSNVILDPLLIPYFQRVAGNGGLGVCVATLVSESWMVAAGIWLAPRGLFDRALGRRFAAALASGGAMAATALLTRGLTPFASFPLALASYVVCLRLLGGLDDQQVGIFRDMLRRRVRAR